jgi:glycosyltransferase involved in cell wall biosynthesis
MTSKKLRRVLWLTNLPAPYRFPIWARLAENLDLKVSFLLKEKNWRNWTVPSNANWEHEYLAFKSKNFGEFDLIPSFRGARRLLDRVDLVVLGGWEAPFFLRTIYLAKLLRIPVIQFYESTGDSHRFNNIFIRKIRLAIFSRADYIVTPGAASTKAVQAMGITHKKIITLFNPVDVIWFHSFAQSHRIPDLPGHRFLYAGRLIELKNVSSILRAFASIKTSQDTLTIAGDGPQAGDLKQLAVSLGIQDSVVFTGHRNQEELAALYAASNTFILASTSEVWGLVINEALASGLHVVVSDKCGVAEFVKDMNGAYTCRTDQKSIQEAMAVSAEAWRGYIQEPEILEFTPEKFADGVLDTISNALNSASNPELIWLTNIPTPYRIPTWKALDSRIRLKILFLNNSERDRNWELSSSLEGLNYRSLHEKAVYPSSSIPLYFNFLKPILRLRKLRGKVIYIDGWESPAFFITALYAKRTGMQLIYGYRGTADTHRFSNLFIRKIRSAIFSPADYIVTAGTASTREVQAMGVAAEKIITLFNPVDVSWFHSFAQSHRMPDFTGHRFLYVGQLIERKNVAEVLRAFASIKTSQDTFTIAGDGPLAGELKELARALSINDSVVFTGHKNQEELATLYATSHTFILASTNEVWGLVINEALASGLHVVVSDKCGAAEFIKDMSGAYICQTDQQSIQKAMEESRLAWAGYIQVPEILKFTPEKFADGILEVLN